MHFFIFFRLVLWPSIEEQW